VARRAAMMSCQGVKSGDSPPIMTSDLSSALEVCLKRDALNKSMFTLLYFTLLTPHTSIQTPFKQNERWLEERRGEPGAELKRIGREGTRRTYNQKF